MMFKTLFACLFCYQKKKSCRSTETCISLNWSVLDVINSVTRGENFLMEGFFVEEFLWKFESIFSDGESGNKEIMLQLSLILCMPITQAGS